MFFIKNWAAARINEPPPDKTNKMTVRPAQTRISLGTHPVWSESLLCAQWVAKDPSFLQADSEDSYQTGQMPRLIWVFAERSHFVGFVTRWLKCLYGSQWKCKYYMKNNPEWLFDAAWNVVLWITFWYAKQLFSRYNFNPYLTRVSAIT